MATDPTYPPETTEVNGQITGFDVDLVGAIASQLGLRVKMVKAFEDTIIPGFTSPDRSYDMGISAQPETATITDNAGTLPYFETGQSLLAAASDRSVTDLSSVCGEHVGAVRGTSGETRLLLLNQHECQANHVALEPYDDDVAGARDVAMGKLTAFVDDYPAAVFLARSVAGVRVVPHKFQTAREVMVFPVSDAALRNAVAAAFDRLRRDGTYVKLLKRWSLGEGELKS